MTLLEPTPKPQDEGVPKTLYLPQQRTVDRRTAPADAGHHREDHDPERPTDDGVADVSDDHDADTDVTALDQTGGDRRESNARPGSFPALRFGRVRVLSLAKIALVFSLVGFLVTVGTLTLLWNVLVRLGLVDSAEEAIATGLGLDDFTIAGGEWFGVVVVGVGALFAFLLVATILLTLVYNATCALFGGVAIEARPVRRLTVRDRLLHGVRRWREDRA